MATSDREAYWNTSIFDWSNLRQGTNIAMVSSSTSLSCTTSSNEGTVRLQLESEHRTQYGTAKSHRVYKHWEYQSFALVQVDPLAQHVAPPHPLPYNVLNQDRSFRRVSYINLHHTGHNEPHRHR